MKKRFLSVIPILLTVLILLAAVQSTVANSNRAPSEDTILYMPVIMRNYAPGPGNVSGLVYDAQNNQPVSQTKVCLYAFSSDSALTCVNNNPNGTYSIENIYTGWYILKAKEEGGLGYLEFERQIFIPAFQTGTVDIPLSRPLSAGQYRVVLSWNVTDPIIDLDANLWLPAENSYHYRVTYYSGAAPDDDGTGLNNTAGRGNLLALPFSFLDIDSQDGTGPETITINGKVAADTQGIVGEYTYAVYNFSRAAQIGILPFGATGAIVKVYGPSGLMATFTPPTGEDNLVWWTVFRIRDNGQIIPINQYSDECPSPYPDTEPGNADTLCP
ncbi:MAG: hypothetical protein OHK0052_05050 [Anaerolineales bacterium]